MDESLPAVPARRPVRHANRAARAKRAATLPAIVLSLPLVLTVAALAIDVGHIYVVSAHLQNTADASALAAANVLTKSSGQALGKAKQFAELNHNHGNVIDASEVVFGRWSDATRMFTAGASPYNAVHVTARRTGERTNPVPLYFAKIIGLIETDLSAEATAVSSTAGFRFLIDDEMIDSDEPPIMALASQLGVNKDDVISDKNGDGYIDLPPGTVLELPTGQIGDAALFEAGPDFAFTDDSSPSLADFLRYNESGNTYGIKDKDLDPLIGVEPVYDEDLYFSFVQPDHVLVSPVYKSDLSDTTPGANAKGERRGLLAFKIIGIGADPDGSGSKLPNLIIKIATPVPPGLVENEAKKLRLVQ